MKIVDLFSRLADDQVDDSSSSSSGIGMAIPLGTAYHHLRKNGEIKNPVETRLFSVIPV
jgi:hypothetical protein